MSLPEGWNQVLCTGSFVNIDGTPAVGTVTFTAQQTGIAVNGSTIVPRPITVLLVNGSLPAGFRLPSTNDEDLNITGWDYTVTENFVGGTNRDPYGIRVPHDAASIDMATVEQVAPATGMITAMGAKAVTLATEQVALAAGHADDAGASATAAAASAAAAAASETGVAADAVNAANAAASATAAAGAATTAANTAVDAKFVTLAATGGAAMVGFQQAGTGPVARTLQDKAREWVTPYDFGAVGDGIADDTSAVQAFFNYIRDNRVKQSACAGKFLLTAKILWGDPAINFATKNTHFDCEFITGYTSTEEAIRIAGYNDACPTGNIYVNCGASTYANRRQWDGVILENTSRPNFDLRLRVEGVKRWGVRNIGAGNNGRISQVNTKYCGSGRVDGIRIPPADFSSNTKNGSTNSTNQRSVLGGVTVPPELLVDDFVVIDGQGHRVTAVDAVAGTVEVYPWVIATSGTMIFAVGGGLSEEGANSNVWQYGSVVTSLGGCGLRWFQTNPGNISSFHSASSVIGIVAGRAISAGITGGSISEAYIEGGAHDIEYLEATIANPTGVINTTGGASLALAQKAGPNSGTAYDTAMNVWMCLTASAAPMRKLNPPRNTGSAAQTITLGSAKRQLFNNNPVVTLADLAGADRNFGINTIEFSCHGSGTKGQPTGTVTIQGSGGATVNGAASVTYSGLQSVPSFIAYRVDGSPINWVVTPIMPVQLLHGSKTQDWPDLATATVQSTTVTVAGAALGDYVDASMSVALNGTRLWGEVTAADTVTVYQRNDTGANVNLASGTLRVRVRKA